MLVPATRLTICVQTPFLKLFDLLNAKRDPNIPTELTSFEQALDTVFVVSPLFLVLAERTYPNQHQMSKPWVCTITFLYCDFSIG